MTRPAHVSIDVDALQHNFNQVRRLAPESRKMPIVKANAYGHGLLMCCTALKQADSFGLLDIKDAISLRKAGFLHPICLLEGFFSNDEIPLIAENKLEPVIHSDWQLDILDGTQQELGLVVWLKIDTGMQRLGFVPEKFKSVLMRLSAMKCVRKVSVMSHLADADRRESQKTGQQLKKFLTLTEATGLERSMANSAAILAHPDCYLDWVRPGIMLYGSSPFVDLPASSLSLKPVMSLRSEIISIKDCQKGDAVGYGSSWHCPEEMKVGVVACGYGDGYPRHAPSGTPIMVAGKKTQLIGRVSMDMITVDLRGIDSATIGSPVELWGNDVAVDTVAKMAGTISYELLCGVTERV
ncbi:MAG: alanine racemase, partial [Gammaproteobacteria bacterium]|nr:alanine racemase [Gammaproteobacteria bacterium]